MGKLICLDTTFLIDAWRHKALPDAPSLRLMAENSGHELVVPSHAAGEFLEGGARVSAERLSQSLTFLRAFRVGDVTLDTAVVYARIVEGLRVGSSLAGRSKVDMWIAAWAVQHAAPLATRNLKHFVDIEGLEILRYL